MSEKEILQLLNRPLSESELETAETELSDSRIMLLREKGQSEREAARSKMPQAAPNQRSLQYR